MRTSRDLVSGCDCVRIALGPVSASRSNQILELMFSALRPGGQFAMFAYLQGLALPAGRRFLSAIEGTFFSGGEKSHGVAKSAASVCLSLRALNIFCQALISGLPDPVTGHI